MPKRLILVMLDAEDSDSQPFRDSLNANPLLAENFTLHFGRGDVTEPLEQAEIIVTGKVTTEQLERATNLRWIAFWSAGMDGKATQAMLDRRLLLTNASGVHAVNIAEHVMGFMLMFSRRLHQHYRSQLAGEWKRSWSDAGGPEELAGKTLAIVGLGRIGEALAVRAKGMEMRVIGIKRDVGFRHSTEVALDALFPLDRLPDALREADHICIALPYTATTHHLFDATMLAHCKPSAYLHNIARGKIVDEAALISALQDGRLAGAGLDVFETEPLPEDSPLWKLENVILTPHVSGNTPAYFQRMATLLIENLLRYLQGQPLNNLYTPEKGY